MYRSGASVRETVEALDFRLSDVRRFFRALNLRDATVARESREAVMRVSAEQCEIGCVAVRVSAADDSAGQPGRQATNGQRLAWRAKHNRGAKLRAEREIQLIDVYRAAGAAAAAELAETCALPGEVMTYVLPTQLSRCAVSAVN